MTAGNWDKRKGGGEEERQRKMVKRFLNFKIVTELVCWEAPSVCISRFNLAHQLHKLFKLFDYETSSELFCYFLSLPLSVLCFKLSVALNGFFVLLLKLAGQSEKLTTSLCADMEWHQIQLPPSNSLVQRVVWRSTEPALKRVFRARKRGRFSLSRML